MSEHCKDCCCARSWEALDVTAYTGRSIPEHITALRAMASSQYATIRQLEAKVKVLMRITLAANGPTAPIPEPEEG